MNIDLCSITCNYRHENLRIFLSYIWVANQVLVNWNRKTFKGLCEAHWKCSTTPTYCSKGSSKKQFLINVSMKMEWPLTCFTRFILPAVSWGENSLSGVLFRRARNTWAVCIITLLWQWRKMKALRIAWCAFMLYFQSLIIFVFRPVRCKPFPSECTENFTVIEYKVLCERLLSALYSTIWHKRRRGRQGMGEGKA